MAKVVSAIINLKDQFSNKLTKLNKNAAKDFNKLRAQSDKLRKSFQNNFQKMGSFVAKGMAIASVAIVGFLKKSLDVGAEYEAQITKLRSVIANTKGVTKEQTNALIDYADSLERTGVVGDEVILAGTQQIATFQLQADSIKKLMPGMADLIAQQKGLNSTTGDAVSIGNLIGKAMSGQVGALSKAGIMFNETQAKILKFGKESEKAAVLAEVLKANVGGVNAAFRKTDDGGKVGFLNALDNIYVKVHEKLQPLITAFMNRLIDKLPMIEDKMLKLIDKIGKVGPILEKGLVKGIDLAVYAFDKLLDIINYVADNWSWIKPVTLAIGGMIIAFKTVTTAIEVYKTAQLAMTVATSLGITPMTLLAGATSVFSGALVVLTSPITWVIGAVAALGYGAYKLYKNWDKVVAVVGNLWARFKETSVFKGIMNGFNMILGPIERVWNFLSKIVNAFKDLVKGGINKLKNFFGFGGAEIPKNALGTSYFPGGLTTVHERGGELINLPSGSQIIPHDLSKKVVNNTTNTPINVTINVQGNVIGNEKYADNLASIIVNKLSLQRGNI